MPIEWAPVTEFIGRNWLFTLLLGAIGCLSREVFKLHGEKATLKAEVDSLKENKADLKNDALSKIKAFEAENIELKKIINEKYSDEAIRSRYEVEQRRGVSIHTVSKKLYCSFCLAKNPPREVELQQRLDFRDWRCLSGESHFFNI